MKLKYYFLILFFVFGTFINININTASAGTCSILSTLRLGSRGVEVVCLQTLLGGLVADGSFGPKTQAAVLAFQKEKGLASDGIFGPKSRTFLYPILANSVGGCFGNSNFSITTGQPCSPNITPIPVSKPKVRSGISNVEKFSLIYTAGNGGSISGATSQTINEGRDGTPVTAMPNSGYVFDAWSDGVLTATRTDTNVTADKTVNAIFLATIVTAPIAGIAVPVSGEIPTATIADTVEYTATISWDTDPVTFASDTIYTATVIITPKAGYTLTGISEDFFTVAGATATNSVDSGIVSAVFPATASSWACGDVLIDSRDSYSYSTVLIDTQCWLAKNLAYLPSVVPSATGDSTDPYYYVYDYQGTDVATAKLETNYINYGALYNYPAALNSCPSGWHLPTDAEWTTLSTYAGGDLEAAGKLKASVTDEIPFDGTNDFNFSAIPSGTRYAFDGTFGEIGDAGSNYLWSSSIDEPDSALTLLLISGDIELIRYPDYRANGYSVRCIKD